jgi:RNA polymerase sigma factor (sigma-70 family)
MSVSDKSATSPTLLGRLRNTQDLEEWNAAWKEFVERFGPPILTWCRRYNLQDADARDLTQQVLYKVLSAMKTFEYDQTKSFRGWLRTITRHAWHDFVRQRQNQPQSTGDARVRWMMEQREADTELVTHLSEAFDLELLELAESLARCRIEPCTWQVYELIKEEKCGFQEVATRLKVALGTVRMRWRRAWTTVKEEVARLENQDRLSEDRHE